MTTRRLVTLVWLSLASTLSSLPFAKSAPPPADRVEGEILVSFVPGTDVVQKSDAHKGLHAVVLRRLSGIDVDVIRVPPGSDEQDAATAYRRNPRVRAAEPNYLRRPDVVTANDQQIPNQWGLLNTGQTVNGDAGSSDADVDASEPSGTGAWDISTGSSTTVVAVVDTGIQITHPDLASNIWVNTAEIPANGIDDDHNGYVDDINGWDFGHNDNSVYDSAEICDSDNEPVDQHGTHLAGTIGAVGNNGIGVAGINWQVRLMPLKFIIRQSNGDCAGADSDAMEAINYAVRMGARVINVSWGGAGPSGALQSAFVNAGNSGAVFGVSAGNSGLDLASFPNYPASFNLSNEVVAAASNNDDGRPNFSSYGGPTTLAAPGVNIVSTTPANAYTYLSGTSMSAAHATGSLALLRTIYPNASPAQLKARLMNTVDPKGAFAQPKTASGGRLNLFAALSCKHLLDSLFPYNNFFGGLFVAAGDLNADGCDEIIVGPGSGGEPLVRVFSGDGLLIGEFLAYPSGFLGGVHVAAGDVDGDGKDEVITGTGPGGGPHVRVWDLSSNQFVEQSGFFAYPAGFYGGVWVASDDVGGPDTKAEVITGAGESGGAHVRIMTSTGGDLGGFFAYPDGFYGGARVAAGNVVGANPKAEVITGAGPSGAAHVRIFTASGGDLGGFFAYPFGFYGGVFVSAGNLVSGGTSEIVTGAGESGGAHVRIFSSNSSDLGGFFAYPDGFYGGVRIAVGDSDGDGDLEIVTGPGPSGGAQVRIIE